MNYKRTKYGTFMYNLTMKIGKWLDKHAFFYWLLLFTNGILESIAGFFVALFFILMGHKPYKNHKGIYFMFGNNWGGFSLSFVAVIANNMSENYTKETIAHENGHSYQVCYLGVLWFFLVAMPSQVRWCIDTYKLKHNKKRIDYDAIWFEGSATDLGKLVCNLYK